MISLLLCFAMQIGHSSEPFDDNAVKLPPYFLGNNVPFIVSKAKHLTPPKGEFETTVAYDARVLKAIRQPVSGNVCLSSLIAGFVRADCSFDADSGVLTCIPREMVRVDDLYSLGGLFLRVGDIKTDLGDRYVGENSFGATVQVQRITKTDYGLVIVNGDSWGINDGTIPDADPESFVMHSKMNASRAKVLKDETECLAVFHIAPPWFIGSSDTKWPTVDYPFKVENVHFLLPVKLEELVWYDVATGEIIAKTRGKN